MSHGVAERYAIVAVVLEHALDEVEQLTMIARVRRHVSLRTQQQLTHSFLCIIIYACGVKLIYESSCCRPIGPNSCWVVFSLYAASHDIILLHMLSSRVKIRAGV